MVITDARRRLIRHGLVLFLLGLLTGLAIPAFRNPRAGLAAHLEGLMNGMFLIGLGLAWKELRLPSRAELAAYGLALYGTYANWVATSLSAVLGTSRLTPISGAGHAGSPIQESLIAGVLVSVALSTVAALGLLIWGVTRKEAATEQAPDVARSP